MCPPTLRPLLADPAFSPGQILPASDLCDYWFRNSASIESFVLRSLFRDLLDRDWHRQGVPAADWGRFKADVLPRLVAVLDALPGDPAPALRDLALAYHSSL